MGPFGKLPNELLEWVVDYCEFEDCKSLRATCKAFVATANRKVFETLHVAFFPSDLNRFVALSNDPQIARCVKNFVFVGTILPEIGSVGDFERLVDTRVPWSTFHESKLLREMELDPESTRASFLAAPGFTHQAHSEYSELPRHELRPSELRKYWQNYQSYVQQQLDWEEAEKNHEITFARAFSRLSNLISVENRKYNFMENFRFPWKQLRDQILIGPNNWMELHAVEVDDENQKNDTFKERIHMRHVTCLLNAIAIRAQVTQGTPLKTLRLTNVGDHSFFDTYDKRDQVFPLCIWAAPRGGEIARRTGKSGIENLSLLDIKVSYQIWKETEEGRIGDDASIPILLDLHYITLAAASSVVELELKCEGGIWTDEDGTTLVNDTFGRLDMPTFPKLRELRLSCTAFRKVLETFLMNHSQTLRDLDLVDCMMSDSTWQDLVAQFPGMLKLDTIYLEGLHDMVHPLGEEGLFEDGLAVDVDNPHPHDQDVINFILHGGKMAPLDYEEWLEIEGNHDPGDEQEEV